MTSPIEKLHTSARRYCIDRYDYWQKQYLELKKRGQVRIFGSDYTDEELNVFPRYNMLNAILVEVEGFTPEDFSTLEEARDLISATGQTAQDVMTKNPINIIAKIAMEEERKAFINFIQSVSEKEIEIVEPLPYRRVLTIKESQQIWAKIGERWGIARNKYWYPLEETNVNNIMAFQDKYFYDEVGAETIRAALAKRGITRLWELREFPSSPNYEIEPAVLEPYQTQEGEGYWSSNSMDWIIYISHENSITIGGWLLDEVKNVWTNWEERIWNPSSP